MILISLPIESVSQNCWNRKTALFAYLKIFNQQKRNFVYDLFWSSSKIEKYWYGMAMEGNVWRFFVYRHFGQHEKQDIIKKQDLFDDQKTFQQNCELIFAFVRSLRLAHLISTAHRIDRHSHETRTTRMFCLTLWHHAECNFSWQSGNIDSKFNTFPSRLALE